MPNNKKKKNKGGGAKKKKTAARPQAQAEDMNVGDLSLDSYPQRETPAQSLQRILQYKCLSDKDDRPLCINLHEKNEEEGDKYVIEYLDVNHFPASYSPWNNTSPPLRCVCPPSSGVVEQLLNDSPIPAV